MKAINLIILLIGLQLITSCRGNDPENNATIIQRNIDFNIIKNSSRFFENSNFEKNKTTLLVDKNGELSEFIFQNEGSVLDYPRGYFFYNETSNSNQTFIRVFIPNDNKNEMHYTYIRWFDNDIDTIKTQHSYLNNGESILKVWYNGKEQPAQSRFTVNK